MLYDRDRPTGAMEYYYKVGELSYTLRFFDEVFSHVKNK